MKKNKSQLETIFLANVVLYLRDIESIIKFKQINKKCQEATLMIRLYLLIPMNPVLKWIALNV